MATAVSRRAAAGALGGREATPPYQPGSPTPAGSNHDDHHQQQHHSSSSSKGRPGGAITCGPLAESHLVLPSGSAFAALAVVPLVLWWGAMLLGIWMYEGLPPGQKVWHAMTWFDRGLLRPVGPLLPFAVLGLRTGIHVVSHLLSPPHQGASRKKGKQAGVGVGTLALTVGAVYGAMALARLAIYLLHYWLLANRYLAYHLVSDHIFLATSLLAALQLELICLAADMVATLQQATAAQGPAAPPPPISVREVAVTLLFVGTAFLYLFVVADMYFTARYFHFPLESFATLVLGAGAFQLPALAWLGRRRAQQLGLGASGQPARLVAVY